MAPPSPVFSSDRTCITFDNRGVGDSKPIGNGLSILPMTEDVAAILSAEKLGPDHVVAHSIGGLFALELALEYPQYIKRLALLCSFSSGNEATKFSWYTF